MMRSFRPAAVSAALFLSACSGGSGGGGVTPAPPTEIGPGGGTLTFAGGVKLVFPPGAVASPTVIEVAELPRAQVEAILADPSVISTRAKRFLGGFSAKPEGLTFGVPVEAWIPITALEAYEIPIQLDLRRSEGSYRYGPTSLVSDGAANLVKAQVQHFSDVAIVGLGPPPFEALCRSCGSFADPACEDFDPLQPACCMLAPALRAPGSPSCPAAAGCDCCREKRIAVTSVDSEVSTADCVIAASSVKVTFLDCPGQPVQRYSVADQDCDVTMTMSVAPPWMDLPIRQPNAPYAFTATATGWRKGVMIFSDVQVFPVWTSDRPEVADFVGQLGEIRGFATGLGAIQVHAALGEGPGVEATAWVNVYCPGCSLDISPPMASVPEGKDLLLQAVVSDGLGSVNVMPETLSWTSSAPSVASLQPTSGGQVTAHTVAGSHGSAVMTATYRDVYLELTASRTVWVVSFTGDWNTVWSGVPTPLSMTVTGGKATGSYRYSDPQCGTVTGSIEGDLSADGYVLSGFWSEPCLLDNGVFEFELAPDGNSFTGWWGRGAPTFGRWDGERVP